MALGQRKIRLCVVWMVLLTCFNTIQAAFWPLFVTGAYGVSDAMMAAFPPVKTVAALLIYFFITPRLDLRHVRRPLLCGLLIQALGLLALLFCLPQASRMLWAVFFSAACEAISLAILGPLGESLMSLSLPSLDRARVISFILALVLLVSTPVGWIAGRLAEWDRALPLILNLVLLGAEAVVALGIARAVRSSASPAHADCAGLHSWHISCIHGLCLQ
jgi:MFS family permease